MVLLCRRRDWHLQLVAVAADEEVGGKDDKIPSMSDKTPDSPEPGVLQRATSNLYEPEPRALARAKVTCEGQTSHGEYCPMNGTEASDYLQPVSDRPSSGYLPMGSPPDYDSCTSPVSYANTENDDPTIDAKLDADCGMMGYDVPPPMHVYSEIPTNEDDDDDGENHIYECLDQAKLQ